MMEAAVSFETFGLIDPFKLRPKSHPTFRSYKYTARYEPTQRQFMLWAHCGTCYQPNTVVEALNLIFCIRPRGCTFLLKILIFLSPLRQIQGLCLKICHKCYTANSFLYRSTPNSMTETAVQHTKGVNK